MVKEIDIRGINSPYVILIQADDGTVIASSRHDEAVYPASITKVMSALVVLEHVKDLDRTCTIEEDVILDLCAEEASMAGFQPGEEVTVRDLLYGALLPSGAECCETLAGLVGGTTEAFVAMMNDKAASLGMDSTCFRNTTGLFDPEHVSTVRDLAVMMQYAIRNRAFREIAGSASHTTAPSDGGRRHDPGRQDRFHRRGKAVPGQLCRHRGKGIYPGHLRCRAYRRTAACL